MSDPEDTLDDEAYEALIEELGLDLDIDAPIGAHGEKVSDFEADALDADDDLFAEDEDTYLSEDDADEGVGPTFSIRDAERPSFSGGAVSNNDGGVELSPELLAELKSVISGNPSKPVEDVVEEDSDTYVEDPFTAALEEDDVEELLISDDLEADDDLPSMHGAHQNVDKLLAEPDFDLAEVENEILADNALEEEYIDDDDVSEAEPLASEPSKLDAKTAFLASQGEDAFLSNENVDLSDDDELTELLDAQDDDASVEFLDEDIDEYRVEPQLEEKSLSQFEAAQEYESLDDFEGEVEPEPQLTGDLDDTYLDDTGFETELDDEPDSLVASSIGPEVTFEDEPTLEEETFNYGDDSVAFDYAPQVGGDRVLPRIVVHAFCQTAMANQLVNKAMKDRRMVNVAMKCEASGVPGAVEFYKNNDMPHLIVVESVGSPGKILAELDELAQYCDESVKVIVIGAANDIRLYRELMRRGVSEYLVPPLEVVQFIRAVSGLFSDPEQPFTGKTFAVTGVKGGVGASTIAHNLAWALSERMDLGTTLVDLDLNFGTSGLDFNNESSQTIADALLAPDRFDEVVMSRLVTKHTENLSLFSAPASLDRTYELDAETYDQVLNQVRSSVPYVVLDLPHIWSDWFKSTLMSADEIVVVAQPDLASLRNGKNMLDFLKAVRQNDEPPKLVVNNVGVPKRPEIPVKDFANAIGVEPSLVLPFDPQLFGTANNNGQMIAEVAPESKCSQGIDYLGSLLSGRELKVERSGSLLTKLLKR